jgi:hypothetical protein
MLGINGVYADESNVVSRAWAVEKRAVSNQQSAFSRRTCIHAHESSNARKKSVRAEC